MTPAPSPIGSWKQRRRVVFGTLVFIAGELVYFTVWGTDTALHQQIAVALIALAGAVIGSYVFGAVWDDKNARRDGG
jgi:hypothetical protein